MTKRNRTAPLALGGLAAALLAAPAGAAAQNLSPGAPSTPPPTAAPPALPATPGRDGAPVTLHLRDTPLRAALQMLFEGSGLQHAVEPAVPNVPITLEIRDVPFNTALRTLLRLAPGVTYRKEGDITIVGMRPPAPELARDEEEPAAPVETAAGAEPYHVEKIPLNYTHVAVLAAVLKGLLIPTEDQVQPGIGGLGGYGSQGAGGGLYGGVNSGGGLGAAGYPGLGNGSLGAFGPVPGVGGSTGGVPGSTGLVPGVNLGYDQMGNSVLVGPRSRRF